MRKIVSTTIATLALSGCATIVDEPNQLVPISSDPEGAQVVITDETGTRVYDGTTPASVTLEKSDGSYWGGKEYVVEISKEGYETQEVPVESRPNGWYIAGNVLFGGLIGWFIVDPLNGDMYTLSPDKVESTMSDTTAHNNQSDDRAISVVLLSQVPAHLRDDLEPIAQ